MKEGKKNHNSKNKMGSDIPSLIAKFLLDRVVEKDVKRKKQIKQFILARLLCQRYDDLNHTRYYTPSFSYITEVLEYLSKHLDDDYGKGSLNLELALKEYNESFKKDPISLIANIQRYINSDKLDEKKGKTALRTLDEQKNILKMWYVEHVQPFRDLYNKLNRIEKDNTIHMYSRHKENLVMFQYDHVYNIQVTFYDKLSKVYFATNNKHNSELDLQTVYGVLLSILYTKGKVLHNLIYDSPLFNVEPNPNNLNEILSIRIGLPSIVLGDFKSLWIRNIEVDTDKQYIQLAKLSDLENTNSEFLNLSTTIFNYEFPVSKSIRDFFLEYKTEDNTEDIYQQMKNDYIDRVIYLFNKIINDHPPALFVNNYVLRIPSSSSSSSSYNTPNKKYLTRDKSWYELFQRTKPKVYMLNGRNHLTIPNEQEDCKNIKELTKDQLDIVYRTLSKLYGKDGEHGEEIIERLKKKVVIYFKNDDSHYSIILPRCRFLSALEIRLMFLTSDDLLLHDCTEFSLQ